MGHAHLRVDNADATPKAVPFQGRHRAIFFGTVRYELSAERVLASDEQFNQQVRGDKHFRWTWQWPEVVLRAAKELLRQLWIRLRPDVGLD